jgi:autonomous glycyl radical cofactor GrcA
MAFNTITHKVFLSIASAGSQSDISEGVKKIGINYLQICSLAVLFPLHWPPAIENVFAVMNAVSSPAQHLLSPDCELSWMSAAEAFYNKQIGFSILPVALVFVCIMLWCIGYIVNAKRFSRSFEYYYDRCVLTLVCILFLLYPTMVKQSLAALACEKIGQNYYLSHDLQEECYVGRHLHYVVMLCLPQVLVFTVGLPVIATLVLRSNRDRLQDHRVRFRYGILFNGYRSRLYWWELTIAIRKVILILIAGVYGSRLGPDMQVAIALLMVMLFILSHLMLNPYSVEDQLLLLPTKLGGAGLASLKNRTMAQSLIKVAPDNAESNLNRSKEHKQFRRKCKNGCAKKSYFCLIKHTNMHMIEFGSLAVCAFTLWSGLIFFLNEREQRMSKEYEIFFSIVVAFVNIGFIVFLIFKFVFAALKESHTKKTIQAWGMHSFGALNQHAQHRKLIKNKLWNSLTKKVHKALNRGSKIDERNPPKNAAAKLEDEKVDEFWSLGVEKNRRKLKLTKSHIIRNEVAAIENVHEKVQIERREHLTRRKIESRQRLNLRVQRRKSATPKLPRFSSSVEQLRLNLVSSLKTFQRFKKVHEKLCQKYSGSFRLHEFEKLCKIVQKAVKMSTIKEAWEYCWSLKGNKGYNDHSEMDTKTIWKFLSEK